MPVTQKIVLVALDLGEASLEALAVARGLAARLDLEVVLVHVTVYPPPAPFFGEPGRLEAAAIEASRKAMDGVADGQRVILRVGAPAAEILDTIRELEPAMVVMGTHGRRGVSRLAMGSVAEAVLRRSPVPVLTVRPPPRAGAAAAAGGARA